MKFPLPLTRLITRRRFLLGSFISALGVVVYTWRGEPHWVCVTQRDMPVRNLPSEWNGKTLAQISDIHVGPRVDFEYLTSACSFRDFVRCVVDA